MESNRYLNTVIVKEISQGRRTRAQETEKETEQRELVGWREWLILLLRVHISPLSLALFLKLRLSAPGSHTRGASHPIITLKWLLPHQWRTGRLARQWSSACFTVLVTFPKLAFPTARPVCVWVSVYMCLKGGQHLSNCCDFLTLWLECCFVRAGTLHHSVIVGVSKRCLIVNLKECVTG